jgi:hypothetical protein
LEIQAKEDKGKGQQQAKKKGNLKSTRKKGILNFSYI